MLYYTRHVNTLRSQTWVHISRSLSINIEIDQYVYFLQLRHVSHSFALFLLLIFCFTPNREFWRKRRFHIGLTPFAKNKQQYRCPRIQKKWDIKNKLCWKMIQPKNMDSLYPCMRQTFDRIWKWSKYRFWSVERETSRDDAKFQQSTTLIRWLMRLYEFNILTWFLSIYICDERCWIYW